MKYLNKTLCESNKQSADQKEYFGIDYKYLEGVTAPLNEALGLGLIRKRVQGFETTHCWL